MTSTTKNTRLAKKPRRMAREPIPAAAEGVSNDELGSAPPALPPAHATQPAHAAKPEKPTSKASLVIDMLQEPAGATIEQMVVATGWLPHTTRAVLTGFKKKGHVVTSDKVDGVRTYRIAPAAATPTPTPTPASSQVMVDA